MSNGDAVIVAVDESAGSAVAWAARTAAVHHAPLHLLRVLEITPDQGLGLGTTITSEDYERLEEHGRWLLEAAAAEAAEVDPNLTVTTELATGAIIPTLLERTRSARMLVSGARGLGALRRALLGSVSAVLARRSHCPFVVVRDGVSLPPDLPTRPILVGVDGTKISEPAIAAALDEAAARGVAVIALHAEGASDDPEMDALDDYVLAESLAGWQERYPNIRIDRETTHASPERSLLDLSAAAQLLVVGTRGRGGFTGKVFGSTSQSLLLSVQTPIMIAPTP
ncbi:universal stress protein [Nocardia seriolae]|uniref:UspA domain-containing protein n=1 Tax=Nocardia seriolae TaxID=37332 RepID=A0A0B8NH54_9NOCA|nr:universal stress protein [Nocardia seriolae]MTJ66104.1 universal stress protein [Nocardia seriolae]MTJ74104.1 universal stress protein [Nocardia seriolae]MTJ85979.1 universal stress protein [Nocardia seriolae]MTK29973.1 universal stress protein [Nocardia seriolae]MTK44099.1 universal stress protein [Nocardia seriolae]